MNNKEIRKKILKRRKVLGVICLIIVSPIILPLTTIYKLGELSEKITDIIQMPFCKLINKSIEKYRKKLEAQMEKEKPIIDIEINIGDYEKAKKFNENIRKGLDK